MHREFLNPSHEQSHSRRARAGSEASLVERSPRLTLTGLFAALALLLWTIAPGQAQILYGSVAGNVTDATKAVVPGAEVELKNEDTGEVRNATTNAQGEFSFSAI